MRTWLILGLVASSIVATALPALAQAPAPLTSAPSGGPLKIMFVDIQRVIARSAAGIAAREQLERDKAAMQRQIDDRHRELERLREDFEKKGPLMTPTARREKLELLNKKRRDAARLAEDFAKDLEQQERDLTQVVLQEVFSVVTRVGKERALHLVLEGRIGTSLLYAGPDADLTDEIIRVYDQQAAGKGRSGAPSTAPVLRRSP